MDNCSTTDKLVVVISDSLMLSILIHVGILRYIRWGNSRKSKTKARV